jgi:hypothetical protein
MGVSCTPGSAAVYTNTWTNTAAQVMGLNINLAPCKLAPSPTTAQWQTIFNQFQHIDGSFAPIARSNFGPTGPHPTTTITNIIDQKFANAATYGYALGNLMFYNNAVNGTNYGWTTNEVQQMRDYLDSLGHTNVGLLYDDRSFSAGEQAWDNNPLVTGILLECGAGGWFANAGNRTNLLRWLWTNSATANKQIIFQIPDYSSTDGTTNKYMADRLLLQWLGTQIMDFDFMRSSRVVFMPVTYGSAWFYPETASPNCYTNTMTSLVLSLIEQKDLFEGRGRIPTVADAFSFYRNSPPVIGSVSNQVVGQGVTTVTIPFTVTDRETPAAALTVSGGTSNGSLVMGMDFGGGGDSRTVRLTLNPALTGTATITLVASDAVLASTNTFQLNVSATASITAVASGPINANATWGVAVPVAGDTNLWLSGNRSLSLSNGVEMFYGQTLVIQTNGQFAPGKPTVTFAMNDLVLDGGTIYMGNNIGMNINLNGHTLALNAGTLQSGGLNNGRDVRFQNGSLAGSGLIDITGTDAGGSDVEFLSTMLTTGFTGTFNVHDYGILNLSAVATPTFGVNLSGTGKYANDADVALTSLVIDGTVITNGTYTYASFTPAQQAFLFNNGGTITVSSNLPPTLTGLTDNSIVEDTASSIPFTVGDGNTAASNLVVCGYSSDPVLVPNEHLFFAGTGANRTLNLTSGRHQFGTNTIYVTVSDGWLSTTRSFNLAVLFTNYPPTITNVLDQIINSNTPTVALFTVGDVETDPGVLAVSATSSNPALVANTNLLLAGSGAKRSLKIIPTAGQTGATTITLTANDGEKTATNSFQITVVPVNTINAVANGPIDTNTTWSGGLLPVLGDTNVWQTGGFDLSQLNRATDFFGNTLVLQNNSIYNPGIPTVTLTVNKLVLSGGTITTANNNGVTIDLSAQPCTLNSGTLKSDDVASRNVVFQNGSLLGSGTINITTTAAGDGYVAFLDSIVTRWFTGTFNVNNNGVLNLPGILPQDASFGLVLTNGGNYVMIEDTALTSLVINGIRIPPGIYTHSDFTTNQQAFLTDQGGSLTVISTTNSAPMLTAVSNRTVIAGQTLAITNVATDADVPAQALTFSLSSPPVGAFINQSNGVFTWRPAIAQSPSTNSIKVIVTDNGSPSMSATNTFTVTLIQPAKPVVTGAGWSDEQFSFTIGGDAGPDYVVLASTNLTSWLPLWTNVSPVLPFNYTDPAATNFTQRFYRAILGP